MKRNFLDLDAIDAKDLQKILKHAIALKKKNKKLLFMLVYNSKYVF